MKYLPDYVSYAEEVGGIFSDGDFEAIPFNHWKKDCEWMVLVFENETQVAFLPVRALNPREAARIAIAQFNLFNEFKEFNE